MRRPYKAVSLSSGAARGFYQLGAIHAAQINGCLQDVNIWAGSSVGAMIACCLAVGWSPMDLFTAVCTDDINQYLNVQIDIQSALTHWGLFDNTQLKQFIAKLIRQKWGGIPTFGELYKHNIIFVCTAYKIKHSHPRVYFSYLTHPDMSVLDAVMLSSNIPLLFRAIQYEGDYYIDGGSFALNPADWVAENLLKPDESVLTITLDLRDDRENDQPPESITDYVKEIVFLPLFNQKAPSPTSQIDVMLVRTDLQDVNLPISIDNKTKIKWFVFGLEQGLEFFK